MVFIKNNNSVWFFVVSVVLFDSAVNSYVWCEKNDAGKNEKMEVDTDKKISIVFLLDVYTIYDLYFLLQLYNKKGYSIDFFINEKDIKSIFGMPFAKKC